jgi:cell wall-associated NlpC family hydrolase
MNNKKIAAIVVFGLTMTTCASPAVGQMTISKTIEYTAEPTRSSIINMMEEHRIKMTQLEAEAEAARKLEADTALMNKALKKLNSHVNKTWYVFSGSTPRGWDCSGLTLWFYEQLGIALEHRASVQDDAGTKTNNPKPGDLVVFKYNGSKQAYHVGIYIGNGEMIHAPKHGHVTRIENVDTFAGNYSKVTYRTLIEIN